MKPANLVSFVLAGIGLTLSAYLTYVHYNMDALVCTSGGCELVQTSTYSEMFGVPIAIFGLVMFAVLIGAMVYRVRKPESEEMVDTGIIMILLAAILYWGYLTWVELFVIYAVCQWCVATSIVTLALLVAEGIRWYRIYNRLGVRS